MSIFKNFILSLGLFCFSNTFAGEGLDQAQKIYLQADQIRIERDGIFVDIQNQIIDVEAIHRDGAGLYVVTSEYRLSRCPRGHYSPDGDGLCDEQGCPYNR